MTENVSSLLLCGDLLLDMVEDMEGFVNIVSCSSCLAWRAMFLTAP
jgi:hypothetical protein